ncbi:galactose oxidase-like domain-containing protein [Streptomyces sp. NPDC057686]|uniref:galactose oxidase-like domain-containing protein n=1 Tax=Streptomyces sp. NPDC057686 TaxID=3346212 RepID=UPI00367F587B
MSTISAKTNHHRRRARRILIGLATVTAVAVLNGPALYRYTTKEFQEYKINRRDYKLANGHWGTLKIPSEYRINTIHAALLHTGKVLLIAGSGNNQKKFDAKKFQTVLWDPKTNQFKQIATPKDMFCSGHTQLPDGKLLVAGGTQRYEKLGGDATKAGGLMIVHNEDPDKSITLPAGTEFIGKTNGMSFSSQASIRVEKAKKIFDSKTGRFLHTEAGLGRIYVEARESGKSHESGSEDNYRIRGLNGSDAQNVYGIAQKLALDKKDFQGIKDAFEFDPVIEEYVKVAPMNEARWYPTLTTLQDGKILSLSGLDEIGQIVPGKDEIYDPNTKTWKYTGIERRFPTYPAIFLLENGNLFYSGSNAGYGPADVGRTPGVWDLKTNEFKKIPGLSDPDKMETSATVMLPPAQDQRFMVIGGGGVGESDKSSKKSRLVDLTETNPHFHDGASLAKGTRYPSASLLPDDTVLVTGGSEDYRGRSNSNILEARTYDPKSDTYKRVADPHVGRNYHSGSILLPDGRVMGFGSDSLFADAANTKSGTFEQRIEIYTPPYLYRGDRPKISSGAQKIKHGGSGSFIGSQAGQLKTAKLIRPSAVTHVTDVDQRSIALELKKKSNGFDVTVPKNRSLVPSGWYMLFVTNEKDIPSEGFWVEVV